MISRSLINCADAWVPSLNGDGGFFFFLGIESSSSPVDSWLCLKHTVYKTYKPSWSLRWSQKASQGAIGSRKRETFSEPLHQTEDKGNTFSCWWNMPESHVSLSLQVLLSFQWSGLCGEASLKGAASWLKAKWVASCTWSSAQGLWEPPTPEGRVVGSGCSNWCSTRGRSRVSCSWVPWAVCGQHGI